MEALYCGIDLHSNNNVVVVATGDDKVVYRKRLRNELDIVLGALAPFAQELSGIVVESTYNWYWLVDGLMDNDYRLHLANTGAIQQYSGLKHCDDESDARWLAKLLSLGILPEGYIYPKEDRPVRDLLRKRAWLVEQRTSNILSIQNLFARNTGRRLSCSGVKRLTNADVDEMLPKADLALAVKSSVAVMQCLNEQIKTLERTALQRVRLREDFKTLLTVDGIGAILGLTIMLETGTIKRFPSVGNFASYCRCVDSSHTTNGKKKGKGNTKNGNKYLGKAFMEAATYAPRFNKTVERYYQRRMAREHVMVTKKAVAHKLARACYCMLRDNTAFDARRAFS